MTSSSARKKTWLADHLFLLLEDVTPSLVERIAADVTVAVIVREFKPSKRLCAGGKLC